MSTQKERMYQRIEKHGEDLNRIFKTKFDNVTLCKKLHSLEAKAHKLAEDYCNGVNGVDSENWDEKCKPILEKVYAILNNGKPFEDRPHQRKVPIFVNGDARGYALKINDAFMNLLEKQGKTLHKDWGGYGILAPEFNGKE